MAHLTKEFRRRVVLPFVIFILFTFSLIITLSIQMHQVIIFIIPTIILIFVLLKALSIKMYKNIKLNLGTFKYSPGRSPSAWHKKMGYLRLLEMITPQEYKIDLYRKCGAKIGDNVILAGKILDPEITIIGANTIIGVDALISAHEIILQKGQIVIRLDSITIGENCVIGAKTVILPGATIPSGTMIPACSMVKNDEKTYISSKRGDKK